MATVRYERIRVVTVLLGMSMLGPKKCCFFNGNGSIFELSRRFKQVGLTTWPFFIDVCVMLSIFIGNWNFSPTVTSCRSEL